MGPGPRRGTADPCPCRHRRGGGRRGRRAGSPRAARARCHVVPLHPPERRRLRRHRRVVDRRWRSPRRATWPAAWAHRPCSSSSIAASGRAWASATSGSPPVMSSPRCGPSSPCSTPRCSTSSWRAREASPTCSGLATSFATPPSTGRGLPDSPDITGSLSPGKRADVIVLRADRPNIAPVNDPIGAVVWGMDTSNIDWVFVGGASLVEHGELTADVASARALAVAAQRQVAARRASPPAPERDQR